MSQKSLSGPLREKAQCLFSQPGKTREVQSQSVSAMYIFLFVPTYTLEWKIYLLYLLNA
jgi:hypothetical protein